MWQIPFLRIFSFLIDLHGGKGGAGKKMWVAPTRQEKTANDSTQLDWRPIVSRTPN